MLHIIDFLKSSHPPPSKSIPCLGHIIIVAIASGHRSVIQHLLWTWGGGRYVDVHFNPPGGLVFQAVYHPRKRTLKHTLNTYFSGKKIDPKYAFFHAFFLIFRMSFPKCVNLTKNTPFFSIFARFCTPKRCKRVHCLVLKNNPNYVNLFTRMISKFKYKCPPPPDFNSLPMLSCQIVEWLYRSS